jgi:hypothetical protein
MAGVSIGDAIGAGFVLIRRQPLVVATWGLAGFVTAVASWGVLGSFYAGVIGEMMSRGAAFNPMASPTFLEQAPRMQGASFLLSLFGGFIDCVVYCAVFRSIIHPEQKRFAYLRIGAAELFTLVMVIAGYIAFLISLVVPFLIIGIIVGGLVVAHAVAGGVIVAILGGAALVVVLLYVLLRFSLIVPMMVSDGKFHFADAWRLTKSHVGALLAISVAVVAIVLVAEIIIGLVLLALGLGYLSSVAGGPSHLQGFFGRPPSEILASAAPLLLILGVLSIPLTGCSFAVTGGPWARAYRDLSGPDLADTFS